MPSTDPRRSTDPHRSDAGRLRELLAIPSEELDAGAALKIIGSPRPGDVMAVRIVPGTGAPFGGLLLTPATERATGGGVVVLTGPGTWMANLVTDRPGPGERVGIARELAGEGLTVLCVEQRGAGQRRASPAPGPGIRHGPREASEAVREAPQVGRGAAAGREILGRRVMDAAAALSALRSSGLVDPARVGVVGGAGGAAAALLLAALEGPVVATLAAGCLSSAEQSVCTPAQCGCAVMSQLAGAFELADVAALIAPSGLILEACEGDPLLPEDPTREMRARLAPLWEKEGESPPELTVAAHGDAVAGEKSLRLLCERLS